MIGEKLMKPANVNDLYLTPGDPVYITFADSSIFASGWYVTYLCDDSLFASNGFNNVSVKGIAESGAKFSVLRGE